MSKIQKSLIPRWHSTRLAKSLKMRRLKFINKLFNDQLLEKNASLLKILDVGCSTGKDFVKYFDGRDDMELYGVDIRDQGLKQRNFTMIVGDAARLDFPDSHFDLVVSMGVLEHINPIEKLCQVIQEIRRVSKSYIVMIPAVSTPLEPHMGNFFWQLKDHNKKKKHENLAYFSDEAWLHFQGFKNAKTKRFWYVPFLKTDLFIYNIERS